MLRKMEKSMKRIYDFRHLAKKVGKESKQNLREKRIRKDKIAKN